MPTDAAEEKLVTVCEACLCACCWQAEFVCESYRSAGLTKLPVSYLLRLNREHPSYWEQAS